MSFNEQLRACMSIAASSDCLSRPVDSVCYEAGGLLVATDAVSLIATKVHPRDDTILIPDVKRPKPFPKWREVVPSAPDRSVMVDCERLANLLLAVARSAGADFDGEGERIPARALIGFAENGDVMLAACSDGAKPTFAMMRPCAWTRGEDAAGVPDGEFAKLLAEVVS